MQKHVNLVDLVKSFPTNVYLQNFASIQKRASLIKFAQLAEKSEKGSISNPSTKVGVPYSTKYRSSTKYRRSKPQELPEYEGRSESGRGRSTRGSGGPRGSGGRGTYVKIKCKIK